MLKLYILTGFISPYARSEDKKPFLVLNNNKIYKNGLEYISDDCILDLLNDL